MTQLTENIATSLEKQGDFDAAIEILTELADDTGSQPKSLRLRQWIQDIKQKQVKERHGL